MLFRSSALVVAGCGYGAALDEYAAFQAHARDNAALILARGMRAFVDDYGHGPTRQPLARKDPRGFADFLRFFAEHSALGSAHTMAGYQGRRPSLYHLQDALAAIAVPTLIVAGDEDEPTLAPSLMLKRTIPGAGLAVLPRSGHVLNLEEPALFNRLLEDFFHQVEHGRWPRGA